MLELLWGGGDQSLNSCMFAGQWYPFLSDLLENWSKSRAMALGKQCPVEKMVQFSDILTSKRVYWRLQGSRYLRKFYINNSKNQI